MDLTVCNCGEAVDGRGQRPTVTVNPGAADFTWVFSDGAWWSLKNLKSPFTHNNLRDTRVPSEYKSFYVMKQRRLHYIVKYNHSAKPALTSHVQGSRYKILCCKLF